MSPPRAVVVLAMLAALVGAPSSVFAAAPNELNSAAVSPWAGTTATGFELSVRYSGGNPANGVTATVAGQTVALWLSSGSVVDGTWTAGTTLPAGSWTVTFQTNADKGPDPNPVTVGPISVIPELTQPPSSLVTSQPSTDTTDPTIGPGTVEPKPQPSAAPSPSGAATPDGGIAQPSGGAAAAASEAAPASHPGQRQVPHRRSGGVRASGSPDGGTAPAQPTAIAGAGRAQAVGRELVGVMLLFGIAGVAAVALLGAAWIIIAARRDRAGPSVMVAPPIDPAVSAIPTVEQRALRRARLRPSDDPILAALGLNEDEPLLPDASQREQGASTRRFRHAARK